MQTVVNVVLLGTGGVRGVRVNSGALSAEESSTVAHMLIDRPLLKSPCAALKPIPLRKDPLPAPRLIDRPLLTEPHSALRLVEVRSSESNRMQCKM
jgi:hypothetical protein